MTAAMMDILKQAAEQQSATKASETGLPGAPSPQFVLLDYFFPGYSMFTSALNVYMGSELNLSMPVLIVLAAVFVFWYYIKVQFWAFAEDYLMSSVTIHTDDEIYNMVMLWLSRQKFAHNSRHFVVNTNINSRNRFLHGYTSEDSEDADEDELDAPINPLTGESNMQKQALHYTPSVGSHFFWYKLRPLTFERIHNRDQSLNMTASEKEELRISCLGRDPRILKELLLEARHMHAKKDDRKTVIYRANLAEIYWQRCMSRLNRPFSTVILNETVKQDLIDDAADYLNPVTRRWYANRGIPYRRGYLLHGPPGTGKSSLSLALAGFFRMKIYIVSLSSNAATEENLTSLFHELPTRCVVLLEDIDSAGLTHTREEAYAPQAPEPAPSNSLANGGRPSPAATGRVSLSGLLNILDGVASQEGRILIMTTNHMEKLDNALIRPGRIDMVIPFGLADSAMAAAIFRAIYAPYDNESTSKARAEDDGLQEAEARAVKRRDELVKRVDEQARAFAEKMPPLEFSPAEVQGLLLRHKHDPQAALESLDSWVLQMRVERKRIAEKEAEKQRSKEMDKAKDKSKGYMNGENGKSTSDENHAQRNEEQPGQENTKSNGTAGCKNGDLMHNGIGNTVLP